MSNQESRLFPLELDNAVSEQELKFGGLDVGDAIMLQTKIGSVYHLMVVEASADGVSATLSDQSHHEVPNQSMIVENDGQLFKLRGSCSGMLVYGDDHVFPVNEQQGSFSVDRRAWLETTVERQDRVLITNADVASLKLIRSTSQ